MSEQFADIDAFFEEEDRTPANTDVPAPQEPNRDIDAFFEKEERRDALRATVDLGSKSNPDDVAKASNLAASEGLPVGTVERNLAEVQRRKSVNDAVAKMGEDVPVTRDYMSNPENAKVSHDDVENLTALEKAWQWYTKDWLGFWLNPAVDAPVVGNTIRGLGETTFDVGKSAQTTLDLVTQPAIPTIMDPSRKPDIGLGTVVMDAFDKLRTAVGLRDEGRPLTSQIEKLELGYKEMTTKEEFYASPLKNFLPFALEKGIMSTPHMALALANMPTFVASLSGNIAQDRATNDGREEATVLDLLNAMPFAAASALLERVGAKSMLGLTDKLVYHGGKAIARATGTAALKEFGTETVQEGLEYIGGTSGTKKGVEPMELAEAMLLGGVVGLGFGGSIRLGTATVESAIKAEQAAQNVALIEALGENAKNSKTRERLPERYRDFVEQTLAKGDVDTVYVDTQALKTLFQSGQVDDPLAFDRIEDLEAALAEGEGTGLTAIPLKDWQTYIAPTDAHTALAGDIKFRPDDMTANEATRHQEDIQQILETEYEASLEAERVGHNRQAVEDAVFLNVYEQLLETGQTPDNARQQASLHKAHAFTLRERYGEDPMGIYGDLAIRGAIPESIASPIEPLDLVIERARRGVTDTSDKRLFGESLQDLARRVGIRDDRGDLVDVDKDLKPFMRKMLRPDDPDAGQLDDIIQAASESGYFPGIDEANLKDAVLEALVGEDVFIPGSGNDAETARRQAAQDLIETLDRLGIDLNAPNAEIKAALEEAGTVEGGRTLDQKGEPRLSALHNLSSENLLFADELGGIAAPSVGVVRDDMGIEGYGEITLIGNENLGDPAESDIFDADAYTSTFPKPEYKKVKTAVAQKLVDEIRPWDEKYSGRRGELIDPTWDNAVNSPDPSQIISEWLRQNASRAMFLEQVHDSKTHVPMTDVPLTHSVSAHPKIVAYFKNIPDDVWSEGANSDRQRRLRKDIVAPFKAALQDEYKARPDLVESLVEGAVDDNGEMFFGTFSRLQDDQRRIGQRQVDTLKLSARLDRKMKGREAEFHKWVTDRVMAMFSEPQLTVNRKKVPYTLDNIVEHMTSKGVQAKESTMTFGGGNARAVAARRFGDIEEMRNQAKGSLKQKGELEADRKAAEEKLEGYRNAALEYYTGKNWRGEIDTWDALDDSMKALAHFAKNRMRGGARAALAEGLRRNGFRTVPDSVINLGIEAGDAMMGAPVPYFEAKPARAVSLNEFSGAVVPNDISQDVLNVLDKHGIAVRKYGTRYDEAARTKTVVAFRKKLAKSGERVLFQSDGGGRARGSISFFPDGGTVINLGQAADLSTFLHESGHFFVHSLTRLAETNERAAADLALMLKYAGVDTVEGFNQTEPQEKLARAFEAYLREGKAPSTELQGVFSRFRAWLINIYRTLKGLDVELDDSIRGVFDRLLATDDQIADAEQAANYVELAGIAELMTPKQQQAYRDAAQRASDAAFDELEKRKIAEEVREERKRWKAEYAVLREEVAERVNARPVYRAIDALRDKESPVHMSRDAVHDLIGQEESKLLPKGLVRVEGGIHPDFVAQQTGFTSGHEMLLAMMNAAPNKALREKLIDELATKEMNDRHGAIRDNEARAAAAASEVVMNDERAQFFNMELRALSTHTKAQPTPVSVAKAAAKRIISGKKVQDISEGRFAQAAAKAGRDATRALLKQDYDAARDAKFRQIMNHYLAREARTMREKAEKMAGRLNGWQRKRMDPKAIHPDFIKQVKSMLSDFSFAQQIGQAKQDRLSSETLLAWMAEKEKAYGARFHMPAELDRALSKENWREMTVEELSGLHDVVKSIISQGRRYSDAVRAQFLSMVSNTADSIEDNARKEVVISRSNAGFEGWWADKKAFARKFMANHRFISSLADELDGYSGFGGPVYKNVYQRIKRADDGYIDRSMKAAKAMNDILKAYSRVEKLKFGTKTFIPELGYSLSHNERLAFALNMGNAGNVEALTDEGFTEQQQDAVLATLTDKDWDVVEALWAHIDSYWPELSALEERATGVKPEKVVAQPFTTPSGREVTGGYYPLVGDPKRTDSAKKDLEARQSLDGLLGGGHTKATTKHGSTIERTNFGDRKVWLDIGVAFNHVDGVIRDIELREAVIETWDIVNSRNFREAVSKAKGAEFRNVFDDWIKNVIGANRVVDPRGFDAIAQYARTGVAVAEMGLSLRTILQQPFGITQTAVILGEKYTAIGAAQFLAHPKDSTKMVMEMSPFMANRTATFNRDVRDAHRLMGVTGLREDMVNAAFFGISMFDLGVSVPSWLGAYAKAEAEGMSQQDAVDYADSIVARGQGTGLPRDMSNIQQGSPLQRLFTMFYSFFASYHNLQTDQIKQLGMNKTPAQALKFAKNQIWITLIPSVVIDYLFNGGPGDDEEWWEWGALSLIRFLGSGMVGVRDVMNASTTGFGYQMTPAANLVKAPLELQKQIGQGEADATFVKWLIMTLGYTAQLPGTRQIARGVDVLADEGTDNLDSFEGWWRLLVQGKEK